jgi:hypothetical protein
MIAPFRPLVSYSAFRPVSGLRPAPKPLKLLFDGLRLLFGEELATHLMVGPSNGPGGPVGYILNLNLTALAHGFTTGTALSLTPDKSLAR